MVQIQNVRLNSCNLCLFHNFHRSEQRNEKPNTTMKNFNLIMSFLALSGYLTGSMASLSVHGRDDEDVTRSLHHKKNHAPTPARPKTCPQGRERCQNSCRNLGTLQRLQCDQLSTNRTDIEDCPSSFPHCNATKYQSERQEELRRLRKSLCFWSALQEWSLHVGTSRFGWCEKR